MLPRDISTPFSHAHLFVRTPASKLLFLKKQAFANIFTRPSLYIFVSQEIRDCSAARIWSEHEDCFGKVFKGSGANHFLNLLSEKLAADEMLAFLGGKSVSTFGNLLNQPASSFTSLAAEEQK